MEKTASLTNYDQNAFFYDQYRRPNPEILNYLINHFSDSEGPILSLGCGTGRMENALSMHFDVIGLDRSSGMLSQARNRIKSLIQGDMTNLPFDNNSFSGLYFLQSFHHVGANLEITPENRDRARKQVLREALRVLQHGSIVIVQRDPSQNQAVWFWQYFPHALETKLKIQPKVATLCDWFQVMGLSNIKAIPIEDPMIDGFYEPTSPLDPGIRRSFSEFSYLSDKEVKLGIDKLQIAIKNGSVNNVIDKCKYQFKKIGGSVFMISAEKMYKG